MDSLEYKIGPNLSGIHLLHVLICKIVHRQAVNFNCYNKLLGFSFQSGGVYAVSEDEMIQYHHVFADSGNAGAQVRTYSVLNPLLCIHNYVCMCITCQ